MSDILSKYYKGITQQLRGEVDLINELFSHQGVKGEGNEAALRDLISRFIPRRYGIGSGVIVDHAGNHSNQCDIVIYDTFQYPSLLSLTSVHMYPVDLVYATIEVKTTLDSGKAKEARENIASVMRLKLIDNAYERLRSNGFGAMGKVSHPLGVVFAFNSEANQFETFKRWFMRTESDDVSEHATILVGCLDQGLIISHISPERALPNGPVIYPQSVQHQAYGYPLYCQQSDGTALLQSADRQSKHVTINGESYPVKSIKRKWLPIDQSRVLLHFILYLDDLLSAQWINPQISFTEHYLTDYERLRIEV
jgi:hypothetical protein